MRRSFVIGSFLVATAGPYLWNHPEALDAVSKRLSAWSSGSSGASSHGNMVGDSDLLALTGPSPLSDNTLGLAPNLAAGLSEPPMEGLPVADFGELFRFDATPQWVTSRWARVTTVVTPEGWQGLRVPVVTGTQVDDLAGSLTYYFDSLHRVQRITFKGSTGDARRLIDWSTGVVGMKRETTLAAELYTRRWSGRPTCVLAIQNLPVMRTSAAHGRFELLLELNPPQSVRGVSEELRQWLTLNHQP